MKTGLANIIAFWNYPNFWNIQRIFFLQKNEENPEEVKTMKYLSVRNLVRFASCVHNYYRTWVRTFPGLVHSYTNCCLKQNFDSLSADWNVWSQLEVNLFNLLYLFRIFLWQKNFFFRSIAPSWLFHLYDGVVLCFLQSYFINYY